MAYLENGDSEEAKNQLIDVLRIDPKDVWGYLLLANLYFQHEEDPDSAEPFYRKAYELNGSVRYFVCEPLFGFKC
jgi:Tfp pilus assembly protein PilF